MKPSKGSPTKRSAPAAAHELRQNVRKRKAVLTMPISRALAANERAERIANHRKQLDSINYAYRECMQDVFNEPVSLAQKRARIKKNVRQFAAALVDWQIAALELLSDCHQDVLVQMLPDFKSSLVRPLRDL
jgi:hypothetical protein